jgi:hypothetical protein
MVTRTEYYLNAIKKREEDGLLISYYRTFLVDEEDNVLSTKDSVEFESTPIGNEILYYDGRLLPLEYFPKLWKWYLVASLGETIDVEYIYDIQRPFMKFERNITKKAHKENVSNFIIGRLEGIVSEIEGISIKYMYDDVTDFHIVEISPESIRRGNDTYNEMEVCLWRDFHIKFPEDDILICEPSEVNSGEVIKTFNIDV